MRRQLFSVGFAGVSAGFAGVLRVALRVCGDLGAGRGVWGCVATREGGRGCATFGASRGVNSLSICRFYDKGPVL